MAAWVIGLGSNLGERRSMLRTAVATVSRSGRPIAVSNLYETAHVGSSGEHPAHLNAALLLETALAPEQLLAVVLEVERAHGRERGTRWGSRTLDLDLLWSEGLVIDTPELIVPHPRLKERAFALRPLLDVAPAAIDPLTGAPYSDALSRVADQEVQVVEGPAWAGLG
jgi:2-amino-4-hydroxy-6-hydroxymethyldihydropteridine diphosphokinase